MLHAGGALGNGGGSGGFGGGGGWGGRTGGTGGAGGHMGDGGGSIGASTVTKGVTVWLLSYRRTGRLSRPYARANAVAMPLARFLASSPPRTL